jgi:hypothetical protein
MVVGNCSYGHLNINTLTCTAYLLLFVRKTKKRSFPPLNADDLVCDQPKRKKKKKRPQPIINFFPPLKIPRLNHPLVDDFLNMDRYENRSFGSANILDPPS